MATFTAARDWRARLRLLWQQVRDCWASFLEAVGVGLACIAIAVLA